MDPAYDDGEYVQESTYTTSKGRGKGKGKGKAKGKGRAKASKGKAGKGKSSKSKGKSKTKSKNNNNKNRNKNKLVDDNSTISSRTRSRTTFTIDHNFKTFDGKKHIESSQAALLEQSPDTQKALHKYVVLTLDHHRTPGTATQAAADPNCVPNSFNPGDNTYLVPSNLQQQQRQVQHKQYRLTHSNLPIAHGQSVKRKFDQNINKPESMRRKTSARGRGVTMPRKTTSREGSISDNDALSRQSRAATVGTKSSSHTSRPRVVSLSLYKDKVTKGGAGRLPILHHFRTYKQISIGYDGNIYINCCGNTANSRLSNVHCIPKITSHFHKRLKQKNRTQDGVTPKEEAEHRQAIKSTNILIGNDKIESTTGGQLKWDIKPTICGQSQCPDKNVWDSKKHDGVRILSRYRGFLYDAIGNMELRYRLTNLAQYENYIKYLKKIGLPSIEYYCVLVYQWYIQFSQKKPKLK